MGRLTATASLLAGAVLLGSASAATAADLLEPPIIVEPPKIGKTWYLRGHIGLAAQHVDRLDNALFATTDIVEFLDPGTFDAAPIFGVGVGFRHGENLRFDVTAEYRGAAAFDALDRYETTDDSNPATFDGTNDYTAKKSELLLMANIYKDLKGWYGITPYVGAGLGLSRNTIHSFRDVDVSNNAVAYGETTSKWNFAWALHAGLGFQATESVFLDLGYSFVSLGNAESGDLIAFNGTNTLYNPMIFKNLTSHDLKLTVRYEFDGHYGHHYDEPEIVKY